MKRRLFNLAAAVSLTVLIAAATMWVRSYSYQEQANFYLPGDWRVGGYTLKGRLIAWVERLVQRDPAELQTPAWHVRSYSSAHIGPDGGPSPAPAAQLGAFAVWHFRYMTDGGIAETRTAAVPFWAIVACASISPVVWAVRFRRARSRKVHGQCAVCGYDLRATPQEPQEGGALLDRCPECGAQAKQAMPQPAEGAAA